MSAEGGVEGEDVFPGAEGVAAELEDGTHEVVEAVILRMPDDEIVTQQQLRPFRLDDMSPGFYAEPFLSPADGSGQRAGALYGGQATR